MLLNAFPATGDADPVGPPRRARGGPNRRRSAARRGPPGRDLPDRRRPATRSQGPKDGLAAVQRLQGISEALSAAGSKSPGPCRATTGSPTSDTAPRDKLLARRRSLRADLLQRPARPRRLPGARRRGARGPRRRVGRLVRRRPDRVMGQASAHHRRAPALRARPKIDRAVTPPPGQSEQPAARCSGYQCRFAFDSPSGNAEGTRARCKSHTSAVSTSRAACCCRGGRERTVEGTLTGCAVTNAGGAGTGGAPGTGEKTL